MAADAALEKRDVTGDVVLSQIFYYYFLIHFLRLWCELPKKNNFILVYDHNMLVCAVM